MSPLLSFSITAEQSELDLGTLPIGTNVSVATYKSEYELQVLDPVAGLVVCRSNSEQWGALPLVAQYAGLTEHAGLALERTSWLRQKLCMVFHVPQGWATSSNIQAIRLVRAFPDQGEFLVAVQFYEAEQEAKQLRVILNPLTESTRNELRTAITKFPRAGRAMLIEFFCLATRERRMREALAVFRVQCQQCWNHLPLSEINRPLTPTDRKRIRNLFQSLDFEAPEAVL